MGLFTRKQPATAAQLGAANAPGEHAAGAALVEATGRDSHRDELANVPDAVGFSGGLRYRLGSGSAPMAGPATEVAGSNDPGAHTNAGAPNPRQQDGGYAGELNRDNRSTLAPEQLVNATAPVSMREQEAPSRPRAGLTGADPARAAVVRLWTFLRDFDKGMADNLAPDGVGKLERVGPLAAVPINHDRGLVGALPSAGGSGATGMDPVGAQPNTFRLLPRAWDEYLVNADPTAPQPAPAGGARRGWRA